MAQKREQGTHGTIVGKIYEKVLFFDAFYLLEELCQLSSTGNESIRRPTFWNGKKSDREKGTTTGTAGYIGYISGGHVDGMVFLMTCCDGNSGFVTASYNRDEHCTMRCRILCYNVL